MADPIPSPVLNIPTLPPCAALSASIFAWTNSLAHKPEASTKVRQKLAACAKPIFLITKGGPLSEVREGFALGSEAAS
jgi:hypothetical protein